MNNQNIRITPAQRKADTRAFQKYKNSKKNAEVKPTRASFNVLSNAEKSAYIDKRLKVKPVWFVESIPIIKAPRYKVARVTAGDCIRAYFSILNGKTGNDNDFFYDTETNNFANVKLEIPYLEVNDPAKIAPKKERAYITRRKNTFTNETIMIKADSYGKLQLFNRSPAGFKNYKNRAIDSIYRRISKLREDIKYYASKIANIDRMDISQRQKDNKKKVYLSSSRIDNIKIQEYQKYIIEIRSTIDPELIEDISQTIPDNDFLGVPQFSTFNKDELVKMGAYVLYVYGSKDTGDRCIGVDYIIIEDLEDSFKYYTTDEDDQYNIIVNTSSVVKSFFNDTSDYYGYFEYDVESIENYELNGGDSALCSFTCLFYNPSFRSLINNIIYDDHFKSYELYKTTGIIAYNSNMPFGSIDYKYDCIRKCHYATCVYYKIKFIVEYSKYSKKTGRVNKDLYLYDYNNHSAVEIRKKDCGDIPIMRTFLVKKHIFNVNNDETYDFILNNIVRKWDSLKLKSNEKMNEETGHLWNCLVHKSYMLQAKNNPDITHQNVIDYIPHMESEIMDYTIRCDIVSSKNGDIIKESSNDKSCNLKFIGYKSAEEFDQMKPNPGVHYLNPTRKNDLYVSMDLETYSTEDCINIYSFSYCIYTKGNRSIKESPVFKYSDTTILKSVIQEEFVKIGKKADVRRHQNVIIHFHYGSKFDTIILEPIISKFTNLDYLKSPPKAIFNPSLISFSFNMTGIKANFMIRDSYRILSAPVSKLKEIYNLGVENCKLDYPYCFYQKIHKEGITVKQFTKQQMIDIITEDDFDYISNEASGKDRIIRDIANYRHFLDDYFKDNVYFNPEEYCKLYNDQDVVIVREALLSANNIYETLGQKENFHSINPNMIAVFVGVDKLGVDEVPIIYGILYCIYF